MLIEPFKVLREKIPFLEYSIRCLQLILKPEIERPEQLKAGRMKFALWDIFLSLSLFMVVIGFLSVYNPTVDVINTLSALPSQFFLLLQFGYYAYFSTIAFFIITLVVMLVVRPVGIDPFKGAYMTSLHYARCYALFLFLFLPLVAIYINTMFSELLTINEFTNKHGLKSLVALIIFLGIYIWCCIIPIKKFWLPVKSNIGSYVLVIVVTNLAFSASVLAPNFGALELNKGKACGLFMKSDRVRGLTDSQQKTFNDFCLREQKHNQQN